MTERPDLFGASTPSPWCGSDLAATHQERAQIQSADRSNARVAQGLAAWQRAVDRFHARDASEIAP